MDAMVFDLFEAIQAGRKAAAEGRDVEKAVMATAKKLGTKPGKKTNKKKRR